MHNNEQEKKNREYLKRVNRCTRCGKRDSYTIGGRSICFECTEELKVINAKYRDKNRENINEYQRRVKNERKEQGLCVRCGEVLPKNSMFLSCVTCRERERKYKRKYDRMKGANYPRGGNGFCWTCNKKPAMEGKKLCEDCYQRQLKILEDGPNRKEAS